MAKKKQKKIQKPPLLDALNQGSCVGSMALKRAKNPLSKNPIPSFRVMGRSKSLFLQGQIKYFFSLIVVLALGLTFGYHLSLSHINKASAGSD